MITFSVHFVYLGSVVAYTLAFLTLRPKLDSRDQRGCM